LIAIVREIGAAAGLADVAGFALLSVLHVSQAREVRRLREWAGEAPERAVPSSSNRLRPRHAAAALVGLLVLAAGAWRIVHHGGDEPVKAKAAKPKRHAAAVEPRTVTVAVLNSTTVPGLAAALREQIAAAGFKKGTIDDFSDHQLAESVVQYAPGHRADAKAVGRVVGIGEREPVAAASRALAPDAAVIVIAGADKAP
jgi:hypothetical protein